MLTNYHTHTTFCDGKNTAEEIVLAAIERGFDIIGFSGHGYTPFDTSYCMMETEKYISEIRRLQEKYRDKITLLLGIEEDSFAYIDRSNFDYIIGSSHYVRIEENYFPIDSDSECLKKCISHFGENIHAFAKQYYESFLAYISDRKPDIVGHFDLITKFDEIDGSVFLSDNEYLELSKKYISLAAEKDVLFEVNTGAIARGVRTAPYPFENLLFELKRKNAKLILSSDSHSADTLDFAFDETKERLRDIGFEHIYSLTQDGCISQKL